VLVYELSLAMAPDADALAAREVQGDGAEYFGTGHQGRPIAWHVTRLGEEVERAVMARVIPCRSRQRRDNRLGR
jgi:hypothetical protein